MYAGKTEHRRGVRKSYFVVVVPSEQIRHTDRLSGSRPSGIIRHPDKVKHAFNNSYENNREIRLLLRVNLHYHLRLH